MAKIKQVKSIGSILLWNLIPSSIGIAFVLGVVAIFIQNYALNRSVDKKATQITRLFSQGISQDLLLGADSEVYRKCRAFFESENIFYIKIDRQDGQIICDLSRKGKEIISHIIDNSDIIYFDSSNQMVAGKVQIGFDVSNEVFVTLITEILVAVMVICAGLYQYFAIRGTMLRIVKGPIEEILHSMRSGELQFLTSLEFPKKRFVPTMETQSLFSEVKKMASALEDNHNKLVASKTYEAMAKLASQVAHDIRSPLAALEMISGSLGELPEDKRLIIRNSINRIRDIANSLLNKNASIESDLAIQNEVVQTESFSNTLLGPLVDSIITEKRIQYRNQIGVQIDFNQSKDSYGLFAKIQPIEFQRVLSNLINNAVEAFKDNQGSVELIMGTNHKNQIELTIKDNGKGIPADILSKLGKRGETYGKDNGSGLGVFHAMETIKSFQGSLEIDSKLGNGTKVSILLPRENEPAWFVPAIKLKANLTLIVFDDDQSIHQIWKGRLESVSNGSQIQVRNFSDPAELRKFYGKNFTDLDEALFLMDYEISGSSENGLDLIENLGIQRQSILVTSRYEEKNIRDRCEGLGIKLIPKSMSGFVPIEIV